MSIIRFGLKKPKNGYAVGFLIFESDRYLIQIPSLVFEAMKFEENSITFTFFTKNIYCMFDIFDLSYLFFIFIYIFSQSRLYEHLNRFFKFQVPNLNRLVFKFSFKIFKFE
ncbi:hypothetical protein HanIR_Chr17g0899291 [Helianthus annuus]|nr:hypothetical protein HanIR_Chr17g0899291 [Helianthus annuus]